MHWSIMYINLCNASYYMIKYVDVHANYVVIHDYKYHVDIASYFIKLLK